MCKAIATALFGALDLYAGTSRPLDGEKGVVPAFPPIPPALPFSTSHSQATASCGGQGIPVLRFWHSQKSLLEKWLLELNIKTLKDSLKVKLAVRDRPCTTLPMGDSRVHFIRAGWYGKRDPILTINCPGRFGWILLLEAYCAHRAGNRTLPSHGATLAASIDRWLDSRPFTATEENLPCQAGSC